MYDLLLIKVTSNKSTMKHSKNSLGLSTSSTADADCSQGKARDLPRICNINSDMVTCFNTEHGNQQTTSNPFDYRKEERESSRFNMPQRATLYKAGLRKFKSRQQSNERELADTMRYQVAIVKSYKLLKEELQRPDVIRISNKLFPDDTELQFEIESANKRRRIADILLKRILACSKEKKSQFIGELRNVQCIKLLVDTKEVTEEDLTKYRQVHNVHYETKLFPLPSKKLMFSIHDSETLKDLLNNEDYIDRINDQFLSKFLFTVDQHSCITNEELQSHKKVSRLIDEMQKCDEKIYKCFKKVLISLDIEGVLQNLEYEKQNSRTLGKREHVSGSESDIDCRHIAKKKKLDKNVEYAVVSFNKRDEKVKTEFEQIGLSIENFENGSIIVTFSAKDALAWEKLKQYCQRGSIDRLVKDIFNHEGIPEELKDGTFKMKLTIYESKESTSDLKKGILVLENNDETSETSIIDSARKIDSGNRSITCLGITDSQCFFDDRRSDIDSGHDKRKEKSINLGSPIMPKKMKQDEDEEEKERRKRESKERKLSLRRRKKESKS